MSLVIPFPPEQHSVRVHRPAGPGSPGLSALGVGAVAWPPAHGAVCAAGVFGWASTASPAHSASAPELETDLLAKIPPSHFTKFIRYTGKEIRYNVCLVSPG